MQPNSAYDRYRTTKHFANLDGLRFVCIIMVIWHHASPVELTGLMLDNRGFLGVDFFFVLSGYLITTLLLREASTYGDFSLRDFYIRRAIRIIPVYFFVVSCVGFYYIVVKGEHQYLELLPFYYLFLSNFLVGDIPTLSPTWSLSVEEQYYLIWPLLLMVLSKRLVIPVLTILVLGNVLIMSGWVWVPEPASVGPLLFRMPNASYAPILMGTLAAIALHRQALFQRIWPFVSHWSATLVGVIALLVALEFLPGDLRGLPNFVIHSVMTFLVLTLVVKNDNIFGRFLTNGWVARIGAISYGIYLYHLIALDITNRTLGVLGISSSWLMFLGCVTLSIVIAEISFRTLEAYFVRFRPKPRSAVKDSNT